MAQFFDDDNEWDSDNETYRDPEMMEQAKLLAAQKYARREGLIAVPEENGVIRFKKDPNASPYRLYTERCITTMPGNQRDNDFKDSMREVEALRRIEIEKRIEKTQGSSFFTVFLTDDERFISFDKCKKANMTNVNLKFIEKFDENKIQHMLHPIYKKWYVDGLLNYQGYSMEKVKESYDMLQRYYDKSVNGVNEVEYTYGADWSHGRLFADDGLSLQRMRRAFRGQLAEGDYMDIDFVNCGPTILEYICNGYNILTPFLTKYVRDRDTYIKEIVNINSVSYNDCKIIIISMINGGMSAYNKLENKTAFIIGLSREIEEILHIFDTADTFKQLKMNCQQLSKNPSEKTYSSAGTLLNRIICTYENHFLDLLVCTLKKKGLVTNCAVLCFDGVMIPRAEEKEVLDAINFYENAMKKTYNINLKVKIKPFDRIINLSKYNMPKVMREYSDENYYWADFERDMCSKTWSSYTEMRNAFRRNNAVMAIIRDSELKVIKISKDQKHARKKNIPPTAQLSYFVTRTIKGKGKDKGKDTTIRKIRKVRIGTLLSDGWDKYVRTCDSVTFLPGKVCSPRLFNAWSGFQAKLLPPGEVDTQKLAPLLKFISEVWTNDNDNVFKYLLSWFGHAFRKPYEKTRKGIILYSKKQQIGKGLLINKFLLPLVYGRAHSIVANGLKGVTARFNLSLMNKILVYVDEVNDLGSGTNYHGMFDTMKHLITDPTVTFEPKGLEKIEDYPDYGNFIFTTNNKNCYKIEQGDSRYCILETSDRYRGKTSYFNEVTEKCFTQEIANYFFSYCYHLDKFVDNVPGLENIPHSRLKNNLMVSSLSSPERFMYHVADAREEGYNFPEDTKVQHSDARIDYKNIDTLRELNVGDQIKCSLLYKCYRKFCDDSRENVLSAVRFHSAIEGEMINAKKKVRGIFWYDLTTIKLCDEIDR